MAVNLLLLAAVAMLTGFCLGWSLRAALARSERSNAILFDEIDRQVKGGSR